MEHNRCRCSWRYGSHGCYRSHGSHGCYRSHGSHGCYRFYRSRRCIRGFRSRRCFGSLGCRGRYGFYRSDRCRILWFNINHKFYSWNGFKSFCNKFINNSNCFYSWKQSTGFEFGESE